LAGDGLSADGENPFLVEDEEEDDDDDDELPSLVELEESETPA
jgi:hypothetical protein